VRCARCKKQKRANNKPTMELANFGYNPNAPAPAATKLILASIAAASGHTSSPPELLILLDRYRGDLRLLPRLLLACSLLAACRLLSRGATLGRLSPNRLSNRGATLGRQQTLGPKTKKMSKTRRPSIRVLRSQGKPPLRCYIYIYIHLPDRLP
jgi:hypothetical protein